METSLELVEVAPGIHYPRALAAHWEEIKKTKRPFIKIEATPGFPENLSASKFGGYPCIPKGFTWPVDSEGNYLYPLAQINFSELPPLEGYPTSGFLQFYISTNDIYGINFDDKQQQTDFRVLFFEESELSNPEDNFDFLDETMTSENTPLSSPHVLHFTAKDDYVGMADFKGGDTPSGINITELIEQTPPVTAKLENFIWNEFIGNGHKIGGYAYFTQYDPREEGEPSEDYILLLQIDSDEKIMWGDAGVGNFFIHPDDLAMKDFSKVIYNWDCA